jgi:tetratricopeptide (TPR) repeat protein
LADNGVAAGDAIFKRFAIRGTPTTLILGGDGAEVDWFVGYSPPPENFQARLEKILKGENTFKALAESYAKNPKDVAIVFGIARKWAERDDAAKAGEKYQEIIALDPEGKAGSYTDGETFVTAPYTEYAKYYLAIASLDSSKPDVTPVKNFIAANPRSRLVKQAYRGIAMSFGFGGPPNKDADAFFAEFIARYPDDSTALYWWLSRIVRDKGPVDKGLELAARLRELTVANPSPGINRAIAQVYDLAGEKEKAGEVYGKEFMEGRVQNLAIHLVNYANYWLDRKENAESALAMADLAFKLQPDSVSTLRSVAGIYVKAGQDAKAFEIYGPAWLAKTVGEQSGEDIYGYAQFWMRQGKNLDSALAAAKKAVELQPKIYFFWSTLSDIYAKMDNRAEAVKALEKAVELAEGNTKKALQKKLDGLKGPAPEKK